MSVLLVDYRVGLICYLFWMLLDLVLIMFALLGFGWVICLLDYLGLVECLLWWICGFVFIGFGMDFVCLIACGCLLVALVEVGLLLIWGLLF